MARLGNLELKALSQALLDLYLPGTYPEFPAPVVALAWRLFSCDNHSRTIGEHIERILDKLRVETRTAAANTAQEVLRFQLCSNQSSP